MNENKEAFLTTMNEKLEDWDSVFENFKKNAIQHHPSTQEEVKRQIHKVQEKEGKTRQLLDALKRRDDETWEKLTFQVSDAYNDMKNAFDALEKRGEILPLS